MTTLRSYLLREDVYRRYMPRSCGTWTQGSCLRLAVALCVWAQHSKYCGQYGALRRHSGVIDHVFYSVDNGVHVLDGDGVSTRATLLRRWKQQLRWPFEFAFPISTQEVLASDAAPAGKDMQRLGRELFEQLGPIQETR